MNNNLSKNISIEEEIKLESTLKLSECQKNIKRVLCDDDFGVNFICEITNIRFYDQVYLSKYVITEICKKKCPFLNK